METYKENSFGCSSEEIIPEVTESVVAKTKLSASVKADLSDFFIAAFTFFSTYFSFVCFNEGTAGYKIGVVYSLFFILSAGVIVFKEKKFRKEAVFPTVLLLAVFISFSVVCTYDFLRMLICCYLYGYTVCALKGITVFPAKGIDDAFFQLSALFFIPIKNVFLPLLALINKFRDFRKKDNKKLSRGFALILGFIFAIPVFILVSGLLKEADLAFSFIFSSFFNKFSDLFENLTESLPLNFENLLPTLFLTPFIFSFIFCAKHGITKNAVDNSKEKNHIKKLSVVNSSFIFGFYSLISIAYLVFIISHFSYLFSAFAGDLPFGYTVSSYARQGFFEMSAVAVINLGLIMLGEIFSKRNNHEELPKIWKYFSLFFCIFTLLLIIIATAKMLLYINTYGLTEKRIAVLGADTVLFVTFILIAISLFKKNIPYFKTAFSLGIVFVTLLLALPISTISSSFNTEMYLSGYHKDIDTNEIRISDSNFIAARNLMKLTENGSEFVKKEAKGDLYTLWYYFYEYSKTTNNLDEYFFNKFCQKNEEIIESYEQYGRINRHEGNYPYLKTEKDYTCTTIIMTLNLPENIKEIKIKNSMFSQTVKNSDGAPLAFGQEIHVSDWCTKNDNGEFAIITLCLENGEEHLFEIRKFGEFTTENTERCRNIGKTDYLHCEFSVKHDGEIVLIIN